MRFTGTKGDALGETMVIAVMFLPFSCVIAMLVGLTGWGLWGIEGGLLALGITWCAAMAIAQIAMRRLLHALQDV